MTITACQAALWTFVASQETGKLSLDPTDPGNWTSGICGQGILRGSKWGVSAAAYPTMNITAMTSAGAEAICLRDFWPAVNATQLCTAGADGLAMVLVDGAWTSGADAAIVALQRAVGVSDDGIWGPVTNAAVLEAIAAPALWGLSSGLHCLIADYIAERLIWESTVGTWDIDKGGWLHRLARIESLAHTFTMISAVA